MYGRWFFLDLLLELMRDKRERGRERDRRGERERET